MLIKTLLVDDERSLLEQAEIFLERIDEDIEIHTAISANKALEMMGEKDFDMIISDYQMPNMDGIEFLKELREERNSEIPFIMFTGKGREEVAMEALNLGADRYLQKGGDPETQYSVLAQAVKQEFEHKEAKERIIELNSLLRSIRNVNRLIVQENDLKTLMEKAAYELVGTRNYKNIEISLLDKKDNKIKPEASSGEHPKREWEVTKDGVGDAPKCVKDAIKEGSNHLVNNPENYCIECEYMDGREYHNTLLIPIIHNLELTGVIGVCHRSERDLSEEEIELLEEVGKDLGLAREKIIVENKLRESEEKFKKLAEITSIAIMIYQDEYWVYANKAAEDILGYSFEELKDMKYWEIVALEHREMVKRRGLEIEETELESGYGFKIITKDGRNKWVYLEGSTIDYEGERAGLVSLIDITENKKKEEELRKKSELLKKTKKKRKLDDFAVEMENVVDEEKLYELMIEASERILNFENCSLDIVEGGKFEVKGSIGGIKEKGERYPIDGILGKTYREGESFLIKDLEEEEDANFKKQSYKSLISVPVGEFGVFTVLSEEKDNFDENDLELAETLVRHTKLVLNRIESEQKLREREKKYRELTENVDDLISKIDEDGIYTFTNKTHEEVLGYRPKELIGREMIEFIHEEDKKKVFKEVEENLEENKDRKGKVEARFRTKDDEYRWLEIKARSAVDEDEILIIARDISERKKAEKREEFLHSLLRHDVGNKNQIIQGYLKMMKKYDLSDEVQDLVVKTEHVAKDNIKLIEKIRKLRKIKEEKEIRDIHLKAIMDRVLSEHQDQLQEKGINLDISRCDGKVKGGTLLKELFSNLVENSIQHTDCDEIRISSKIEEDECVVTVEDNGAGISDEKKDKIFDKGFKSGENAGTGLGLYMVKEIAESYGGSVEVKDSDIGGVRFEIHLEKAQQ